MSDFIIKGSIIYSRTQTELNIYDDAYLVCVNGRSEGVFNEIPERFQGLKVYDYSGRLIIPGFTELHVHAPQYSIRSLGMDKELLEWLNGYTFAEEAKYKDLEYARKGYGIFVNDLVRGAATRASIFATLHVEATELLMDMLEESGLHTFVGKVNMDRNSPPYLCEPDAERSAAETERWITDIIDKYENTRPILTPRFIPSCSDELLKLLGGLQMKYSLPVQSHLSENHNEIKWVSELCPWSRFYGDAYDRFGLFGGEGRSAIMAHCVHSTDEEIELMKQNKVFVAHCPQSNAALASGAAPVRRYLEEGIPVGIGSDVAGGFTLDLFRSVIDAVQVSKLRWSLMDDTLKPLSLEEAFYMATAGGGAFFGRVGSFDKEYELDAIVLDDQALVHPQEISTYERFVRLLYLGGPSSIIHKFVSGREIF